MFLIEHFKIFLVISDDSFLINESIMPGIFKLSLISINPRLKAPCGEVPDLGASDAQCLIEAGGGSLLIDGEATEG